jgi:hypothetical protein
MVGSAILIIAICGLLYAYISCALLNESNRQLMVAANDSQRVLEQMKGLAYNQINNFINTFDPASFTNLNNESVTFPSPNIGTKISTVTVDVGWINRGRVRHFQLTTRFAE